MKKPKPPKDYTPIFLIFWKEYPARWNQNLHTYVKRKKYPAFVAWQKLTPEIQQKCLRIVKLIKKTEGTPRDAVTWLNQRGYDDIDEPDLGAQKLPQELTNVFKRVDNPKVNVNNERNRQIRGLAERN
jgi:hypothetical protein